MSETTVTVTVDAVVVRYLLGSVTIRDAANDAPNTCQLTLVDPDVPPVVSQRIRITIGEGSPPRLLFSGTLETVEETYVGTAAHTGYACTAQDDTPKANRRIPLAYYANEPADAVAIDLVSQFAPGFTTDGVQAGLPPITVHFEGSEAGMNGCLRQIAKLIGGYFYWEDRDLHLFTEEAADAPDDLDDTPNRMLNDPPITIRTDDSQIRTRVYGKGHPEYTEAEIAPGATEIPVGDVSLYPVSGGDVISESQILAYTGTSIGGSGALVGTTVTPTNAPSVTPVTHATGIDAGTHYYAYTFYDGTGETKPSPNSAVFTSGSLVDPPASGPACTLARGGSLSVGNYQWKTAFVDSAGGITTVSAASNTLTTVNTPTAPTSIGDSGQSAGGSGVGANLDAGAEYRYAQSFVSDTTDLESEIGPNTDFNTSVSDEPGFLEISGTSNPPGGHSRRFYRTEGNGSVFKRLPGPANGFAVEEQAFGVWYEGYADNALGFDAFTVANYRAARVPLPFSTDPNVVSINIYRTEVNGSTFKLVGNSGNGNTAFDDTFADGTLGATAPVSSTAVYRRANLTGIAAGPSGTTGRKVYRTAAGGSQLKLLATIADNTTSTYADSTVDASLGANVPTTDTSGLVVQVGDVPAGSTTLLITSTGPYLSTGGWASIGNMFIRYTGFSASALTGIPASGPGALNSTVRYGAEVISAAMLTGVSGIVRTLIKGAPIHIWVQEDDLEAQAALAAREGEGDGVVEHRIVDERRGEDSLRALCRADLAQFSRPLMTVTGATRDIKFKSGKPVFVNLMVPNIQALLTVQDVTIDQIGLAEGLFPRFTFTASSLRFSVEDLLRRMASTLDGV